ncbi:hypothetical protein D3C79_684750 [compost metagenome]
MGDHHLAGVNHHAGITHADGDLPAQRLKARAEHIAERPRAMETGDLGQLLMQRPHRQVVDMGHRRAEREHAVAPRFGQHLLDDAAAGDQTGTLDPGDIRGLRSQRRGLVHIIARLRTSPDQPLVFQVGIGLQHRGMTDVELRTHLAYRRHPLTRLIDTTADVFGQLLGDTLVEQQVGHDRFSTRRQCSYFCTTRRLSQNTGTVAKCTGTDCRIVDNTVV